MCSGPFSYLALSNKYSIKHSFLYRLKFLKKIKINQRGLEETYLFFKPKL